MDAPILAPCPARYALAALAPTSILQVAGTGQRSLSKMRQLVTSVPCYSLQLGKQTELVPPMLTGLLKELGEAK